jgi:FkbM family methyltransferase
VFVLKAIEKIVSLIPYRARLAVYHTPPLLSIGRVILGKIMPSNGLVEITAGPLKGLRMWVNLKCQKYYWLGTHEPAVQEVLKKIIRPGWICCDIGAHIGYFSLMMARLTGNGGKVFAFEPDPDNFSLLSEHIRINGLSSIVDAVPLAVSSRVESAVAVFQKGPASYSSTGKLSSSSNEEGIEVEVTSLDEFVYRRGYPEPNFIKIDVEGFEGEVLSGADRILTQARPVIVCEIHNLEESIKVLEKLYETGYLVFHIEEDFEPVNNLKYGGHWLAWHETRRAQFEEVF